jgi:N-acetylglutamate synthase/N-acetylornithine aminotransferase
MATMLAFIVTDAAIDPHALDAILLSGHRRCSMVLVVAAHVD